MAKKPQNPNSLKNLQPPFVSGDPRIAKAHTKEANAKRVESLKKTLARKKEAEETAEVVKVMLSSDFPKDAYGDIEAIKEYLPSDLDNVSKRTILWADVFASAIREKDTAKKVKAAEVLMNAAGEKPAEKTDLNVMAESAKGVNLLMNALLDDDDEDEDDD